MIPDFVIYVDGGYKGQNPSKLGVAAVVCTPDFEVIVESARWAGEGTNNVAEYRALSHGIHLANLVGARQPLFISDSMLVVQQLHNFWATNGATDDPLTLAHSRCASGLMTFERWGLKHVRREKNKRADWLVSNLLEHSRTLKNTPKIEPVEYDGDGRPGWSNIGSSRKVKA